MKKYSGIIVIVLSALVSFNAGAAGKPLAEFLGRISDACVSFKYSFVMNRENTRITGSGDVVLQDDAFRLNGNGLEIWCDGKTSWTVDRASEEIVIQPVDDSDNDFASNPALLVSSLDKNFTEVASQKSMFSGAKATEIELSPAEEVGASMNMTGLKLYFKEGTSDLMGIEIKMEDGTVTLTVSGFRTSEKNSSKTAFRFDENIPSGYVVTDLR